MSATELYSGEERRVQPRRAADRRQTGERRRALARRKTIKQWAQIVLLWLAVSWLVVFALALLKG